MMMTPITGMIKAGENVTLTGAGTVGEPYVISAAGAEVAHLVAGDNVTITGTGTAADPYVISSAGGQSTHLVAGENTTVTGTGTAADPFVVSSHMPARGQSVVLELADQFSFFDIRPSVTRNADGSMSLSGTLVGVGPLYEHASQYFAPLPEGYYPTQDQRFVAYATVDYAVPRGYAVPIDVSFHGALYVTAPKAIEAGYGEMRVWLDGVTYWPGA